MDIKRIIQNEAVTIKEAIKAMDRGGIGFLVVVNSIDNVLGIVSNGDFRRAIINGFNLTKPISSIMNKKFVYLSVGYAHGDVIKAFNNNKIQQIPVLKDNKLVDIITEEKAYNIRQSKVIRKINLPVVIMAGGKGTRLDPFTRILPKPLIPIGNKPVIEVIMEEFAKFGMHSVFISLNHKGKMIKAFFEDFVSDYSIKFITEEKPLGTAGALKLLSGILNETFFVTNCDIIIKEDYSKIFDFHKSGKYDITMVASMRNYVIPYGVCEIQNGGTLKSLKEKPEYSLLINTGLYLINPDIINLISKNEMLNMTDLIRRVQFAGRLVGVYPVMENAWVDIGQLDEYKRSISQLAD